MHHPVLCETADDQHQAEQGNRHQQLCVDTHRDRENGESHRTRA